MDKKEFLHLQYRLIQMYFRDFDAINREQNRDDRFVEYEGQTLSQEEFVIYKLEQYKIEKQDNL